MVGDQKEKMKVIFLDRDGVINKNPKEHNYIKSWDEFVFLPGARKAIKRLNNHSYSVIVVSNQAGINKGLISQDRVEEIHRLMAEEIKNSGGEIRAVYYCPHREDENCDCRKPHPGLLLKAARDFSLDLKRSYLIGDAIEDISAGERAGCQTILVLTGRGKKHLHNRKEWESKPDFIAKDIEEAVDWILQR